MPGFISVAGPVVCLMAFTAWHDGIYGKPALKRVGGLYFFRLGRLRVSWCIARPAPPVVLETVPAAPMEYV